MPQKQILIVEDNELNRAMLSEILSGEYQVLEAENGQEALDILKQKKDSISLILLDVMMPVMDGYTFLDRVKADPELALVPVIVMTQSEGEADEVSALTHGATDFVPKPYRPQVILHRVASIIKLRENAAMVNLFQYDRLTGLYSREFFYRKVKERLLKHPEKEYTIVCSNIENFKLYNDIFGVLAGDKLLQETASNLQKEVGEHGICGRYSADRFLCLQEREQEMEDRVRFWANYIPMFPQRWKMYLSNGESMRFLTVPFRLNRCVTGHFWRLTASKGSIISQLLFMTMLSAGSCCVRRLLPMQWRLHWLRGSLSFTFSPSTA